MVEERARRRLSAILAADVVAFSRLMERDEAGTFARLRAHRVELFEPAIDKHHGRVFKLMGDGLLAEFDSVVDAVECSTAIQHGMAERNNGLPPDDRIDLRIGINLGDVIVEGEDRHGEGVNIAARLQQLAEPGSILVSGTAYDHIKSKAKIGFEYLGPQTLKNIAEPVRAYRLADALAKTAAPAKAAADRSSIVVLPFANSGDPEQAYLSDGITEDIITELSRYRSLLVIARSSSFQFSGPSVDIAAVRRRLGVRYLVEGSIRKVGAAIRVSAQLIDTETESHLWAERYDRDIKDIFAIQDELASAVAATLEGRIAARGAEQARRKPTKDWGAYDYFLQGRELMHRYSSIEAEPFFARAVALDPAYVHAHAWRALALTSKYVFERQPETIEQALTCAQRALELDDADAWSHQAMGYAYLWRRHLDLAGVHFDRAISLNPNDVNIVADRANWLMYAGRLDEALRSLDSAMQRDPYPATWVWEIRGSVLYQLERYNEAIAAFQSVSAHPFWMQAFLAAAYAQAGQLDNARRELAAFLETRPGATLGSVAATELCADKAWLNRLLDGLRKAGLPE